MSSLLSSSIAKSCVLIDIQCATPVRSRHRTFFGKFSINISATSSQMNRTSKPLCIVMNLHLLLLALILVSQTSAKSSAPLESSNNHIKAHNADQDATDESVKGLNLNKEDDPDEAQEGSSGEFMLGDATSDHIHYYL